MATIPVIMKHMRTSSSYSPMKMSGENGEAVNDTVKAKSVYIPGHVSPEQRATAKAKREKNRNTIDSTFNKAASDAQMSTDEYSRFLKKRNSGKDAGLEGLMIGGSSSKSNGKSSSQKAPCKGGVCSGLNTGS